MNVFKYVRFIYNLITGKINKVNINFTGVHSRTIRNKRFKKDAYIILQQYYCVYCVYFDPS